MRDRIPFLTAEPERGDTGQTCAGLRPTC